MIEIPGYRVQRELGRGAFATVYLAHPQNSPPGSALLAVKAVRTAGLTRKLAEALTAEIAILRSLRSPHIVRLEAIEKIQGKEEYLLIVMEWCEGGDLAALLRKEGSISEDKAALYTHQLSEALRILRQANLVHRDIKPQNLLLSRDHSVLKLADFGFARFVEEDNLAETLCGSPLYMAPEILRYEKYDERADLWSVGAVLWEMLFGAPPFRAQNHIQLLKVIERTGSLEPPKPVSKEASDLLSGLLQADPVKRLDYSAFLEHPFIRKGRMMMSDSVISEGKPIPIGPRKLTRSGSSSSSSPKASGISVARRQSIPSSLASITVPKSSMLTMTGSSREQLQMEDELRISGLPEEAQIPARMGIILADLSSRTSSPTTVARKAFSLLLSALKFAQEGGHGNGVSIDWLLTRLSDLEEKTIESIDQSDLSSPVVSLYDHAMKVAVEGGFQELLGNIDAARMHYARSFFILDTFSPVPLSGPAIEEYKQKILERAMAMN